MLRRFQLWLLRKLLTRFGITSRTTQLAASGYEFDASRVRWPDHAPDTEISRLLASANIRNQVQVIIVTDEANYLFHRGPNYIYREKGYYEIEFGPIECLAHCRIAGYALLTRNGIVQHKYANCHMIGGDSFFATFNLKEPTNA